MKIKTLRKIKQFSIFVYIITIIILAFWLNWPEKKILHVVIGCDILLNCVLLILYIATKPNKKM
ncbi:MAG TPA: hypothetical protein PK507_00895 [bacterium]|jgi:multisubunit Na+/H+ antiporter MnhC subunit|nr:hypothetical protein [bacterium]